MLDDRSTEVRYLVCREAPKWICVKSLGLAQHLSYVQSPSKINSCEIILEDEGSSTTKGFFSHQASQNALRAHTIHPAETLVWSSSPNVANDAKYGNRAR